LPWLAWIYLPLLIWIVIGSVASGWHYLIDLPVGAGLCLLCLALVRLFLPETQKAPIAGALECGG